MLIHSQQKSMANANGRPLQNDSSRFRIQIRLNESGSNIPIAAAISFGSNGNAVEFLRCQRAVELGRLSRDSRQTLL